jgi:hypothetical protein
METIDAANHEDGELRSPFMSIDDINPDIVYEKSMKYILNSPRTLEALRRQGVDPAELDPVTEE